jgi:hypothetical protein
LTWIKDAECDPVVGIVSRVLQRATRLFPSNDLGHQTLVAFFFPVASLFVATHSVSTFHVSVMAITPAIANHEVHRPSNFSAFMYKGIERVTVRGRSQASKGDGCHG